MCQALGAMLYRCYIITSSHQLLKGNAAILTISIMQKLRLELQGREIPYAYLLQKFSLQPVDASFLCSLHMEKPADELWWEGLICPCVLSCLLCMPLHTEGGSLAEGLEHSLHSGARFLAPQLVVWHQTIYSTSLCLTIRETGWLNKLSMSTILLVSYQK